MKFFDLFGKTRTHPVRHVRGHAPNPAIPSAEQRDATARKIDTIESAIASEIASVAASVTDDGLPPPHATAASGFHDPVMLLRERIEEACLLHASGQSPAAASLLAEATAMPVPDDAPSERRAWLMRLELASFAGRQTHFEDIALDYARRFETSPPQWRSPQVRNTAGDASPPAVSFRGRLCGSAAPALTRLEHVIGRHDCFSLDLTGVTEVDTDGSRLLLEVLSRWQRESRHGELAGIDGLLGLLRQQVAEGRRDPDDGAWLLLIELLRLTGRTQEYEEACVAYSLTYEISPPAAPGIPARTTNAMPKPGHVLLPVEIRFPVEDLLDTLGKRSRDAQAIVLDCRQLQRIEFSAAAPMLAGILRVARGKPVEWHDVAFLVSTLLQLVGGDSTSRIINRKP